MRFIIMAAGKQSRWLESTNGTELEDTPKQLVPVLNITGSYEPLINRTVRLLKAYDECDIWVTTNREDIIDSLDGVNIYRPENNTYEIDKLLSCKDIWEPNTCFLYGDCFYSRQAIFKIISVPVKDRFLFFGRFHVSYFTGHGGELFCKKIADLDYMEECANWVKQWEIDGNGRGGGWEFYRRMCGVTDERVNIHCPYDHFIDIDDITDDFDGYEQYKEWEKYYMRIGV